MILLKPSSEYYKTLRIVRRARYNCMFHYSTSQCTVRIDRHLYTIPFFEFAFCRHPETKR